MKQFRTTLALLLCATIASAATEVNAYTVKYSGGSMPYKSGQDLRLSINGEQVELGPKKGEPTIIPAKSITEVSYGQEVHRRIGTAVGLAVISLGIGALTAFSKSKKHYIGFTWDDNGKKGGTALQADKNEFRGLLMALEGVTGRKAVNTDTEPTKK